MTDERQILDPETSTDTPDDAAGREAAASPQAAPPPGDDAGAEGAEGAAPAVAKGSSDRGEEAASAEPATPAATARSEETPEAPEDVEAGAEREAGTDVEAGTAVEATEVEATPDVEAGTAVEATEVEATPDVEAGAAIEATEAEARPDVEAGAAVEATAVEATEAEATEVEATPDVEADAETAPTGEPVAAAAPVEEPADSAETPAEAPPAASAEAAQTGGAEAETPAAAEAPQPAATAAAEPAGVEASAADASGGDESADDTGTAAEEPEDPALAELRRAREQGVPVEGKVIGWNRGGFHVVVGEVTAFCPSSEMELGRPRSPSTYVDRSFRFKVVKFQKRGRRVVLSRSAVLTEERQEILAGLQPGKVVTGTVTSLPDFGAFVDIGGLEGLVHVSEISRSRVQRPKDALQSGQQVEVKILKIEDGGERISLSMKDLEPDPWKDVAQRHPRGSRFSGKVMRQADFGLFVELEPEVEGLVHVSQLPPGKDLGAPELQPGQAIEGWVREVDTKRQRISLSLREVPTEDPWKGISQRFPEGEMVAGTVESIAPFGVFIALEPGVTGLLPNSQTGLPRGASAARAFTPGQEVRVQVLSVDSRRKRISLGKEGSHVEASKADLQAYRQQQREQSGLSTMAAAFARLKGDESDED